VKTSDWTIQRLLSWITQYLTDKGIDSPRLSAELLLSHVLSLKRIELYTHFDQPVSQEQLDQLHELVKRAGLHEPVAYLIGRTEFYSLRINVTPDCMIPRPETELLVERAIDFLRTRQGPQWVCDLCTGSGCVAIAVAVNFLDARVIATDISDAALAVAATNLQRHRLQDRISLLHGDLFEPLVPYLDTRQFDLIVCNPPYVSTAEYAKLDRNVRDFEPRSSLLAGVDGLDVHTRIAGKVGGFLKPDGVLMLEIGYTQADAVRELLEQTGVFSQVTVAKDLSGRDRVVIATKTDR